MPTTNERTVLEIRGMVIDIRSSSTVYIEIGERFGWVCERCGWESPLRSECKHIKAAKVRRS